MKCLVLGGAGFIGSHIVDALVDGGHEVRVFDRPNISTENIASHIREVQIVHGDFSNANDIDCALDGVETVIHLISTTLPGPSNENPVYDVESNLVSTLNLLQKAVERRAKRIVFASSGGTVYGIPEFLPIPENHPTHPICSYGISKLTIEKYLHLFSHLYNLDFTVLRLGNPYGPRQRIDNVQGAVSVFLGNTLRKKTITIWGDGSAARDYFYISDLTNAFIRVIEGRGRNGIYNIGSGCAYSLNEIIAAIRKVTGMTPDVRYTAGRKLDVPSNCLDIHLAGQELNWCPEVSLEEGISYTWEYMKKTLTESDR